MSDAPPPHPHSSSGADTPGCALSCSKLLGNHQRQIKHAQLLAGVENSCAPVNNARAQKNIAPATPSSVDQATPYNQRSMARAKKLLRQAVANVSKENMTPIPELPPILTCVMGGEQNTTDKSNNKLDDADIDPAIDQMDINPANEAAVELPAPTSLVDVVCPASMFDIDKIIDNPSYFYAAKHLCQSVGNQASMMSICISCNHSGHHFCTKYLSKQRSVDLEFVIMVKDFTKEGEICWKRNPPCKSPMSCFASFARANEKGQSHWCRLN
jgi:hypothetical protein